MLIFMFYKIVWIREEREDNVTECSYHVPLLTNKMFKDAILNHFYTVYWKLFGFVVWWDQCKC